MQALIEVFADIIKDIILTKDLPWHVKATRLLVFVAIAFAISSPTWIPKAATLNDFSQPQKDLTASLTRMNEENAAIDASFLFVGIQPNGAVTYFDTRDSATLIAWATNSSITPVAIDEFWYYNKDDYREKLVNDRVCIFDSIRPSNQKRLLSALPGNDSNRAIICPLINRKNGRVFGAIVSLWTSPKGNTIDSDVNQTVDRYRRAIEPFILSRPAIAPN